LPRRRTKSYSFTLSRGQIIFLVILFLLFSSLIFSLGLVGGYGMFISSLRQQLPKQGELKSSREESEQASFYETLPDEAPLSQTTTQTPRPSSTTTTTTYRVQVGAFRQEKEARALQERLQGRGYQVVVTKVELKEKGSWFRVRVGNCANKTKAQELAKKLQQKEHLPTLIVK